MNEQMFPSFCTCFLFEHACSLDAHGCSTPKDFCLAAVQRSDGWDHAGVFHAGCALRGKGAEASHAISEHCLVVH